MTDAPTARPPAPCDLARRCEGPLAHAWMVRTFVKHSEETEDFPEIMGIARSVFDLCMALESRTADEKAFRKMLSKKLPKLRRAAEQFAADAPQASTHTNFQQAAVSVLAAVAELEAAAGTDSRNLA